MEAGLHSRHLVSAALQAFHNPLHVSLLRQLAQRTESLLQGCIELLQALLCRACTKSAHSSPRYVAQAECVRQGTQHSIQGLCPHDIIGSKMRSRFDDRYSKETGQPTAHSPLVSVGALRALSRASCELRKAEPIWEAAAMRSFRPEACCMTSRSRVAASNICCASKASTCSRYKVVIDASYQKLHHGAYTNMSNATDTDTAPGRAHTMRHTNTCTESASPGFRTNMCPKHPAQCQAQRHKLHGH